MSQVRTPNPLTHRVRALTALIVAVLCLAVPAGASADEAQGSQISPLVASVDDPPEAVRGTDQRWHLVYELLLQNTSASEVRLDRAVCAAEARSRQASKDPAPSSRS